MHVQVIGECGYFQAMLGLSLSYNQSLEKMPTVADRLFKKGGGHNKFLESMVVWLVVDAPRYWHQEMDTYRVGMTKQSESTMHTILREPLAQEHFEGGDIQPEYLNYLNSLREAKEFYKLKRALPESFIQRRQYCTNYMTLRNIFKQRYNHKLPEWEAFCDGVYEGVEYKNFLEDLVNVSDV